jgi:hypothetical protein
VQSIAEPGCCQKQQLFEYRSLVVQVSAVSNKGEYDIDEEVSVIDGMRLNRRVGET